MPDILMDAVNFLELDNDAFGDTRHRIQNAINDYRAIMARGDDPVHKMCIETSIMAILITQLVINQVGNFTSEADKDFVELIEKQIPVTLANLRGCIGLKENPNRL